jgi:hypothetical protein
MLGDASDFTPLDLLGSLGLNAASTHFACKDGSLRVGIKIGEKKEVHAATDYRFLAGLGAAVAAQFGPPMARRVGHDVATGLLGSYVATETCRMAAEAKQGWNITADATDYREGDPRLVAAAPPADAGKAPRSKQASANRGRGSMNSAYGW